MTDADKIRYGMLDPEPEGEPVCECGEREGVTWAVDPYLSEIVGEYEWHWMCPACYEQSCMEI
jgi:hypothetical protein